MEPSPWLNRTFPIDKIVTLVKKDKKRRPGSSLDLVTLSEIGQADHSTIHSDRIGRYSHPKKVMSSENLPFKVTKRPFEKSLDVPTSKSYSNRLLILSALAPQKITLSRLSPSSDTLTLIACLHKNGS